VIGRLRLIAGGKVVVLGVFVVVGAITVAGAAAVVTDAGVVGCFRVRMRGKSVVLLSVVHAFDVSGFWTADVLLGVMVV